MDSDPAVGALVLVVLGGLVVLAWHRADVILFGIGCIFVGMGGFVLAGVARTVIHENLAANLVVGGLLMIGLARIYGMASAIRAELSVVAAELRAAGGLIVPSGGKQFMINGYPAEATGEDSVVVRTDGRDFHFATRRAARRSMPPQQDI